MPGINHTPEIILLFSMADAGDASTHVIGGEL